ncbi:MmgE/PrpD family protein [Streptomyces sioyaensis]|uniref:MmgE/PrpD family protein n=1 Tax=Streptomyces sioyaensis TaxID=67364 RepID=A0A4Q1R5Q3_9ACTN|nr:MmgE/PrpD family protein [Streptomyces sioyaensis]
MEQFADFAAAVTDSGVPAGLRRRAAHRVLDVLGNALAASTLPISRTITAVVDSWGGHPAATAVGGGRYPAPSAALVNGTLAHALDFDDTHLPSVLHPSASIVPAALAAAEVVGASGTALLDAATVGTELCVRLGMAGYDEDLRNSIFFERGQHATAICGAVGAAVAAAMLHQMDSAGISSAAGIAASMGSGLLEANRTGGTVKQIHTGWAAHAGLVAADMARAGITGPPTVLEGRFGFFQAWCGNDAHPEHVVKGLGETWDSREIHIKPYPCNHFTHAGIDAALQLRASGVQPQDIAELELGAPTAVLRTIAQPIEAKAAPSTGYAAAFSGPYTIAAALTGGDGLGVWLSDFTDQAAHDPQRRNLAATVRCVADPWCDELFPRHFPAVLRARTRDGQRHEIRIKTNRGGPDRPLSAEELGTKFRLEAQLALPHDAIEALRDAVLTLDSTGSVKEVMALIGRSDGSAG